ncbi:hypothetical protein [Prosthecomicrobium hirschii]|uniref:hypothetical protein n=1 Tax=Prosthecodimorpha hirschii TaxID=665126 RepID=UPI001364D22A|nr:hypothetical protein [Prosthecomicrobium hirschii]
MSGVSTAVVSASSGGTAAEYDAAIAALRRQWLAERAPGETAADWLRRTGRWPGARA